MRCQRTSRVVLALVLGTAAILGQWSVAHASIDTIGPRGTRVYFARAATVDEPPYVKDTYTLLSVYLTARGYTVTSVRSADFRQILKNNAAFVIIVSGTSRHVTGEVFVRTDDNPRLFREDAPDAEGKLAATVFRYITVTPLDTRQTYGSFPITATTPTALATSETAEDLRRLAARQLQQQRYEEALDLYRSADLQSPPGNDDLFNVAACLDNLNRKSEAQGILEQIYRQDPDHEEAALSLANHYLDEKRFTEAIAIYSRWSDSPRNGPVARFNLGIAYWQSGNLSRAREQMATIAPNDRLYDEAARNLIVIDRLIADANRPHPAASKKHAISSAIDPILKYWTPIVVGVPLIALIVFRQRVRPSIVVELAVADSGRSIRVRNTSAADVAVFDLKIDVYASKTDGEQELASLTSDLRADGECLVPITAEAEGIRVALAGVYYLFPKVRVGAFRFRKVVLLVR